MNIPSGYSVGRALEEGSEYDMVYDYEIPEGLTGEYYFVLFADGFNNLDEKYEQNNYLFFSSADRAPLALNNGVIQNSSNGRMKSEGDHEKVYDLRKKQPNAYSTSEIAALIDHQRNTGKLDSKIEEYKARIRSRKMKAPVKRMIKSDAK